MSNSKYNEVFVFGGQGYRPANVICGNNYESDGARRALETFSQETEKDPTKPLDEKDRLSAEISTPAIITAQIAAYEEAKYRGLEPDKLISLSVGGLAMYAAAGVIPNAVAIRMAKYRGELTDQAAKLHPGSRMIAVLAPTPKTLSGDVEDKDTLWYQLNEIGNNIADGLARRTASFQLLKPVNWNHASQIVMSGTEKAVDEFVRQYMDTFKLVELDILGGYHCDLMASAQNDFMNRLNSTKFDNPNGRELISSTSVSQVTTGEEAKVDLGRALTEPALFYPAVKEFADRSDRYWEIGPNPRIEGDEKADKGTMISIIRAIYRQNSWDMHPDSFKRVIDSKDLDIHLGARF